MEFFKVFNSSFVFQLHALMIFFLIPNHMRVCLSVKCGNLISGIRWIIYPLKFISYESVDEVRAWTVKNFHTYDFSSLAFLLFSYIECCYISESIRRRILSRSSESSPSVFPPQYWIIAYMFSRTLLIVWHQACETILFILSLLTGKINVMQYHLFWQE